MSLLQMQMPGNTHASFVARGVQEKSFQGSQLYFVPFITKHFGGASTYFRSSQVLRVVLSEYLLDVA